MVTSWTIELEGRPGGTARIDGTVRIGRDLRNDVVIHCPGVAPHHLTLLREGGAWWVEPAPGASVGCNGDRVPSRRRLAPGDRLAIGDARLSLGQVEESAIRRRLRFWGPWLGVLLVLVGGLAQAASTLPEREASPVAGEGAGFEGPGPCREAACREEAARLHTLGMRLWEERELAPGKAFEAWLTLKKSGEILGGGAEASLLRHIGEVEAELERRCGALRFAASRHLALGEARRAARVLAEMKETFPTGQHRCSGDVEILERALEAPEGERR